MSTNTIKAIEYGIKLIGTPYGYWEGGDNQKTSPMFAQNGKLPDKDDIISLNCAGLCNVMLRSIGKDLPFSTKYNSIGGTESYFEYYQDKSIDFCIDETYPVGTLLMRNYRNLDDQGHVAVIIEKKGKISRILHSHVTGEYHKSTFPGVNAMYTLEESHNSRIDEDGKGCYYEKVVLPQDWLE